MAKQWTRDDSPPGFIVFDIVLDAWINRVPTPAPGFCTGHAFLSEASVYVSAGKRRSESASWNEALFKAKRVSDSNL